MTLWTLLLRSLRFHARSHLGALLGAAVGTAVLVGALAVGDSVRGSLRQMALARLGQTQLALSSGDRLFTTNLAWALVDPLDAPTVPAIRLYGAAATGDGTARANRVQVLGVDGRFWGLGSEPLAVASLASDEVVLNETLSRHLRASVGDSILLRVPKPSQLSRDAPISPQEDFSAALRVRVRAIASDSQMGRFNLRASQLPPFNAFVSMTWLQERLGIAGRANLLLVGPGTRAQPRFANAAIARAWRLADAELELRKLPQLGVIELRSSRVFLEAPVADAAQRAATNASGVLTYFVNELRLGDRATPYSMVAALGAPVVPPEMPDDEILINQWLAEDLGAKPGDELALTYYVVGLGRALEEKTARFRVRSILPLTGFAADPTLMPDFPGLKDAKNCREWDTGLPVDMEKIREKDNEYWEAHRGTPKAFVTLAAGQRLWVNRFGNLTAVRYPLTGLSQEQIAQAVLRALDPASVGLRFEPVREQALAAVNQAQDFGGLFLGFSFFLIVAALLLMALLFQFGIEQRATEVGTLLAVGFTPKQVRRMMLLEGGALALLGGIVGAFGGVWYARAMLHGLSTIWRDAVGTSALGFHAEVTTLILGTVAGVAVAWLTIWLAVRKQARQPARELLAEGAEERGWRLEAGAVRGARAKWLAVISGVLAISLVAWAVAERETAAAGAFFGAGALLLIAGLAAAAWVLSALSHSEAAARITVRAMGTRNCARRRKRSLATLGLLACGSFLIAAVGANRLDAQRDATRRSSGTGGFGLLGEASLPVVHDLNTAAGREFFGLDSNTLAGVSFVPFRVREGDDASCLNLNRAQKPRLLGVRPELLAERGAFTFAKVAKGLAKGNPWRLLHRGGDEDMVHAIGDAASIQWAMGKKLGDTITYTDERGGEFKVKLVAAVANSILQGNLIIDEAEFVRRFPSESGYRMFLIDCPSNRADEIAATLSRAMQDVGLELTPTVRRLAAFNAVQNTYLNTFQVLGGLGLLLGSVGLGVVVLRNVLERRSELALLLAVGFRPRAVRWLVVSEHGALLVFGLAVGVIAAGVAVLPALLSPGATLPYASLGLTLLAVLLSGALWTWLAAVWALRGKLTEALRSE
jgi:ABC-type antimicrobial peptide transport system permease subunit